MIVVFDLGGVLVRIARTWGDAAACAGVDIDPARAEEYFALMPGLNPYQAGTIGEHEFISELQRYVGAASWEDAMRVHQGILLEPYPGTLELVHELHRNGFQTGCLSNTNAPHWARMSDHSQFPAIASLQVPGLSHVMQLEKPHPEIYHAFEGLADLAPREILFFDDLQANVDGAKLCGWNAHRIDPLGDTAAQVREHLSEYGITLKAA